MDKQQPANNIKISFSEAVKGVNYSNFALVNNSSEEFLLDFANIVPGKEGVEVFARIALSPRNAKLFAAAVVERVKAYEAQFGEISSTPLGNREAGK